MHNMVSCKDNVCHIVNISFIVYVLLFVICQKFILDFDGAMRIPLILLGFSIYLNLSDEKYRQSFIAKPSVIWLLWCIYHLINWVVIGNKSTDDPDWVFLWVHLFIPYVVMCLVLYESRCNYKRICWAVFIALFLLVFLGLVFQYGNINAQGTGGWEGRFGTILGNHLPLAGCSLLYLASFMLTGNLIKYKHFWAIFVLVLFVIVFVATRKAFGAVIIILFFHFFSRIKNGKHILGIFLGGVLLFFLYNYILDNTVIGARLSETGDDDDYLYEYGLQDYHYLSILGDRIPFYVLGWTLFCENPINGIGINNFMDVAQFEYPLHTEYMVQLTEGGIIGTVIYIVFVLSFGGLIIKYYNHTKDRTNTLIYFSGFFYIAFISFSAWIYSSPHYFVVLALIIYKCKFCND